MNFARTARAAALACASATLAACTTNPYTGEQQFIPAGEAQIEQQAALAWQQIRQQEPVSTNAALNARAERISNRLLRAAGQNPAEWEVVVFDSPEANAFALPGGRIGVYTGMMEFAENDDQLAAVIGHEIGHVLARHAGARLGAQMAGGLAASLGGAILGGGTQQGAQQWARLLTTGAQVGVLGYSRDQELDADILGVDIMAEAGYDPQAAVALWRKMARQGGARGPAFLSTHPNPGTRIEQLQAYIQRQGYS